jgi:hypothetical protein
MYMYPLIVSSVHKIHARRSMIRDRSLFISRGGGGGKKVGGVMKKLEIDRGVVTAFLVDQAWGS